MKVLWLCNDIHPFKQLTLISLCWTFKWHCLLEHPEDDVQHQTDRSTPFSTDYERKVDKCKTMVLLLWWRRRRRHIVSHKTSSLLRTEAHDMLTIRIIIIIIRHLNGDIGESNSWPTSLWIQRRAWWRIDHLGFIFNKRWVLLNTSKWSNKGWEIHCS